MKLGPICQKSLNQARWIFGGAMLPFLSGCDTEVQAVILGGLEDLATTLIGAFFLSVAPEETTTTTTQAITEIFTMLG